MIKTIIEVAGDLPTYSFCKKLLTKLCQSTAMVSATSTVIRNARLQICVLLAPKEIGQPGTWIEKH